MNYVIFGSSIERAIEEMNFLIHRHQEEMNDPVVRNKLMKNSAMIELLSGRVYKAISVYDYDESSIRYFNNCNIAFVDSEIEDEVYHTMVLPLVSAHGTTKLVRF